MPRSAPASSTLTLPDGTTKVSYADLGRHVDAAAMVDAALAVGRTGNPLAARRR